LGLVVEGKKPKNQKNYLVVENRDSGEKVELALAV
jgi:hypothetical protein